MFGFRPEARRVSLGGPFHIRADAVMLSLVGLGDLACTHAADLPAASLCSHCDRKLGWWRRRSDMRFFLRKLCGASKTPRRRGHTPPRRSATSETSGRIADPGPTSACRLDARTGRSVELRAAV